MIKQEEIEMLNDFSEFEIQMESTNNFFYICENLRTKIIPSFYSPTDYKEIKMDYFNKGAFLIRRKEINQLKNSTQNLRDELEKVISDYEQKIKKLRQIKMKKKEINLEDTVEKLRIT